MDDWGALLVEELEKPERVEPADLLPLILLELRHCRDALHGKPDPQEILERWREQMKRLGHWDERYVGVPQRGLGCRLG